MKTNLLSFSAWAILAAAAAAQVPARQQAAAAKPAGPKPVFRDAATHDQLAAGLHKIEQEDPMRSLKKTQGADPSVVNRPPGILEVTDMITFNGLCTLVPKRAIIQLPATFTARLNVKSTARLVGWSDFYATNRGWITTVEVNRTQAAGNEAIGEETQKEMVKSGNLVVATLAGGPISVAPLKVPMDPATAATTPGKQGATTNLAPKKP